MCLHLQINHNRVIHKGFDQRGLQLQPLQRAGFFFEDRADDIQIAGFDRLDLTVQHVDGVVDFRDIGVDVFLVLRGQHQLVRGLALGRGAALTETEGARGHSPCSANLALPCP